MRAICFRFLLLVLLGYLIIAFPVQAQSNWSIGTISESEFTVERAHTTEEGLPANGVNKIIQDTRGYIWAATYNGLVRYDGRKMKNYNITNIPDLQSNRFLEVIEDSRGRIWAGLEYNNLMVIDEDSVVVLSLPETKDNINDHITVFSESPNGKIWVGTNHGLFLYDKGHFTSLDKLKSESVQRIVHNNDFTYILFQTVLYRLFPDGSLDKELLSINDKGEIEHQSYTVQEVAEPGFTFTDMSFQDDEMWVLSHGGLTKMNNSGYEIVFTNNELNQNLLHGFNFQNDTLFVFGTDGLHVAPETVSKTLDFEKYSNHHSNDLLIDHEDAIWLATGTHGLRQFESTPVFRGNRYEQLYGKAITSILLTDEKDSPLYIGTNCDGLYKFSGDNFTRYSAESGIENNCVWSMMEQSDGTLWVGTWGRGLFYSSPGSQEFRAYRPEEMGGANAILSIYEDSSGDIWYGTYYNGLFRKKDDKVEPITMVNGAMLASVRSFYEDNDERLWVATDRGMGYVIDGYVKFPEQLDELRNKNIRTIQQDEHDRFWIGSYGDGLSTFVPGGTLSTITQEHGLFDNTISQLAFDNSRNLWLGGNLGVFYIEKDQLDEFLTGEISKLRVSRIGVTEGLPIRETTGGFMPSTFMNEEGNLYIPTVQGLAVIHTERMNLNRALPNVIVEEVEVDGEVFLPDQTSTLSYKSQRLVFRFAALTYSNPDNARFQYKLEGFDTEWHDGDEVPEIVYTSLSPGDYTLHIRASNNDGFRNEAGTQFNFSIMPPFWQTIGFYLAITLLSGASVIWFINYRTRLFQHREKKLTALVNEQTDTIRKEKERLEKAYDDLEKNKEIIERSKNTIEKQAVLLRKNDDIKSRFFANISHELRAPLTLIKGILEHILNSRSGMRNEDKKLAQDLNIMGTHANRLQAQVDYLLELSNTEIGDVQMSKRTYDLNVQVSLLADLFQSISEENEITFNFEMVERPVLIQADPEKIEKVLLSLFSKIIYYTPKGGWVKIKTATVKQEGSKWAKFIIKSSAENISEEEKNLLFDHFYYQTKTPGIPIHAGLALVKEWVKLHNGRLKLEPDKDQKLCMQISLPHLVLEAKNESNILMENSQLISSLGISTKKQKSDEVFTDDKKNIVLVEDNVPVRIYLRELFKREYNILDTGDGLEALELIQNKNHNIDLVISDLMMPEMSGYELCQTLKKNPETSTIPFILLTAKAGDESYIDGIKSGIDAYITKPFNETILKETVRNLIGNRDRLIKQFREKKSLDQLILNNGYDSLLVKLDKMITEEMASTELSIEVLANRLHISQRQLQRKIKEETGLTPKKYLRKRRLEAARHLIEQNYGSISEVAYAVGFNTLSLFSSYFKSEFGKLPSEWNRTEQE